LNTYITAYSHLHQVTEHLTLLKECQTLSCGYPPVVDSFRISFRVWLLFSSTGHLQGPNRASFISSLTYMYNVSVPNPLVYVVSFMPSYA